MTLEVGRRWIGGIWRTGSVDEPTGGGSLPSGGSTGEVLTKQSDADGDAGWDPSGGSQPGAAIWRGPYHIDHTDFPTGTESVTLFATTAGDVLVGAFYDATTAENWDETQGPDLAFGEDPLFETESAWSLDLAKIVADLSSLTKDLSGGTGKYVDGVEVGIGPRVFEGGHFKARLTSSDASATGVLDLYFAIATPVAPS